MWRILRRPYAIRLWLYCASEPHLHVFTWTALFRERGTCKEVLVKHRYAFAHPVSRLCGEGSLHGDHPGGPSSAVFSRSATTWMRYLICVR